MIHQHGLRNSTLFEGGLQSGPYAAHLRAPQMLQRDYITAVIVQDRQRTHWAGKSLRPFEIHLPQFIGLAALETFGSRKVTIPIANQVMAIENAMHRAHRDGTAS